MPHIELRGHFAVITSITEQMRKRSKLGLKVYGWRYMALLQIDPSMKPPSRIDPRIKSIKHIVCVSESYGYYTPKGFHAFQRERRRLVAKADRWNKMYPLHIVAKDWPLPLPVYAE